MASYCRLTNESFLSGHPRRIIGGQKVGHMKIDEIKELLELVENSTLEEFEMEKSGVRIRMRKSMTGFEAQKGVEHLPSAASVSSDEQEVAALEDAQASDTYIFTAPIVGTFYRAPKPDAEPFVQVGSKVSPGTTLCTIEAMKIFNQIESDVTGEVLEILVENGEPVEYGAPLFKIRTE